MYLAVVGETKRAQALIRRGALVNRLGWTPLQYAASKGHLDTVKMLLANKALVNAPAPDGTTALMMAALANSEPVVQLLLHAGADVTTQNLNGYDAAKWARIKKHEHLAVKLDALIATELRQRAALRDKNRRTAQTELTPENNPEGAVSGVDITGTNAHEGPANTMQNTPQQIEPPRQSTKPATNSPYFDLERFEKNPQR